MTDRLYWPSWFFAAFLTGIVGGFMLGHALILARFLDWLLLSGVPALSRPIRPFAGRPDNRASMATTRWPGSR